MSRQSHFERLSDAVLTSIQNGATLADAAREHGLGESTVAGWLRRGRDDRKSKYGAWATEVDHALESRRLPPEDDRPADRAELLMLATKAARAGNVTAMRLLSELLEPDQEQEAPDPFDALKRSRSGE